MRPSKLWSLLAPHDSGPLPDCIAWYSSWPAGSKARDNSRRGWNAAIAASRERSKSRRNVRARVLEEGIALRAVNIDIIYLNGYGFPAYRGGPMWYADSIGLKKVYDRICEIRRRLGNWWEPAPLLKRLAEQDETFAEFSSRRGVAA